MTAILTRPANYASVKHVLPKSYALHGNYHNSQIRPQKIYTVGCLFSAIGGFTKAFQNVGARVLWANEKDRWASETYKANYPNVNHFHKPIEQFSRYSDNLEPVDILTAGFPCQPFSIAGGKLGFDDDRGMLFMQIIRLIQEFSIQKPKVLLLENVKNLRTHDKGRTFRRIMAEIQNAGYWFTEENVKVLNTATHTEIPQNRERIFMVAMSQKHFPSNTFKFPEPLPTGKLRPLKDFLSLDHKPDYQSLYFQKESQYYPLFEAEIQKGDRHDVYLLRRSYVRRNKSGMCFTLMANMGEGGHNVPVIKDRWGIRKLTPRECARLQGYEDYWFKFPEKIPLRQIYKQLGNSVTVPLVTRLASEIIKCLNERPQ